MAEMKDRDIYFQDLDQTSFLTGDTDVAKRLKALAEQCSSGNME